MATLPSISPSVAFVICCSHSLFPIVVFSSSGYLYETTFKKEVLSDLVCIIKIYICVGYMYMLWFKRLMCIILKTRLVNAVY